MAGAPRLIVPLNSSYTASSAMNDMTPSRSSRLNASVKRITRSASFSRSMLVSLARPLVLLGRLLVQLGAPARRGRNLHVARRDLRQRREQLVAVGRLLRIALHDAHVGDRRAQITALERAEVAVVVVGRDVQLVGLGEVGDLLRR